MKDGSRTAVVRVPRAGALTNYDPDKGVKRIAVAEMAEKHYARAKDATKLEAAIRAKLEAQAEFVLWWDTQGPGKNHGGVRQKGKISDPKSWPVDAVTVSRWRKKLGTPEAFDRTYVEVCAKYVELLEFLKAIGAHVGQNTGETEWFTPEDYITRARRVLGDIDLDPASTPEANTVVRATRFYTAKKNGLEQPWAGRVWMNPPYVQPLVSQFCERLSQCFQSGDVTAAIVLVNNATETGWFGALANVASTVCFPDGRVRFWHPQKDACAPLQGQAVLYLGPDIPTFVSEFNPLGAVWVKP